MVHSLNIAPCTELQGIPVKVYENHQKKLC